MEVKPSDSAAVTPVTSDEVGQPMRKPPNRNQHRGGVERARGRKVSTRGSCTQLHPDLSKRSAQLQPDYSGLPGSMADGGPYMVSVTDGGPLPTTYYWGN